MEAYHWVISEIWRGFVRRRSGRRALPARYVDGIEVLCHLRHHGGIQTPVREAGISILYTVQ